MPTKKAAPQRRRPVDDSGMRAKAYTVLARAVEEGVTYGLQRAHKHTDTPTSDVLRSELERAVLDAICEVFAFDAESAQEEAVRCEMLDEISRGRGGTQ